MSASRPGTFDARSHTGIPDRVLADEAAAFEGWREAVQDATSVLVAASRIARADCHAGADPRLATVLAGLRDLEVRLEGC
jgi:hypothetical protein